MPDIIKFVGALFLTALTSALIFTAILFSYSIFIPDTWLGTFTWLGTLFPNFQNNFELFEKLFWSCFSLQVVLLLVGNPLMDRRANNE